MSAAEAEDDIDPLAPRRNPALVGHQAAEQALLQAALGGRLPHAIMLGGPRGIGKATLAYRFARWLMARAETGQGAGTLIGEASPPNSLALDPEHPVARRISAGGHADLLTVERGWDMKRKKLRGEIVIDDVRAVAGFLRLTPAEGGWRVVVVDSADEMNRNAANGLLKLLEEPPRRALLLLVCHAPGRLLPTIRSRCRKLYLQPLAEEEVIGLVRRHRPDLGEADAGALARLADGSVGRALELADADGLDLYRTLLATLGELPRLDPVALHRLADRLAGADAEDAYRTLTELLMDFLARLVAGNAEGRSRAVLGDEAELLRRLGADGRLDRWIDVWETLRTLFARADGVNLDRKQVVLDAFFTLQGAARA
ncbi:MAG TPA: DNA polymerase III subunit delta' [Aliidongia sp.]|nr:DNA polymerase III subunit delta' [Aliidongia sp.]